MIKGTKIRFDVHNILYSIYKFNKTLNCSSIKKIIDSHSERDIAFINNVTLNSMRFHFHTLKIIRKYIKKKIRDQEKILLISAITQIVFLDFKEYAVINCSVEIAKKLKLYPGLINASLKNIAKNKGELINIEIKFDDLPNWFQIKTSFLSIEEKNKFIKNFNQEPDVHIVFKNKEKLEKFDEKLEKSSDISGFLIDKKNITDKKSFVNGDWWVQDFSSFFPLHCLQFKDLNKKFLDACAAPGGKSFQLLSKNINVTLNDKSKRRIQTLKANLNRLKFNAKILNGDFLKLDEKEKYDVIIIDAPCSAVGTIRKNPEILFKNEGPNFSELDKLQKNMLEKASILINKNGYMIYMTCSFLKNETEDQINRFLKNNNNFLLCNFNSLNKNSTFSKLIKNNFIMTLPNDISNYKIDGYFAASIKRIR